MHRFAAACPPSYTRSIPKNLLGSGCPRFPIASGTAYNVAGQPTGVTFGSGDSDGYGYDPNTGRQTGFQANVGGTNPLLSGTLNWNANASLGQLTLNYNGGTETCNYAHDDLSRIASVSCNSGATWGQTFEYDAFGNIIKTGTVNGCRATTRARTR